MHPPFDPTPEQRRMARAMSGLGLPQDQIALLLEIDPKTLRKHFRDDLDRGMAEANVKVGQTLFSMATTGNNVAATIFSMKARAGWREKHEVVVSADPLEKMTTAELEEAIAFVTDAIEEAKARDAMDIGIGHKPALIEAD